MNTTEDMDMARITYFADDSSMGDTSGEDCNAFRSWAENELRQTYPGHTIEVSDKPSLSQVHTDDEENRDEIEDFCSRLWDRCDWNF